MRRRIGTCVLAVLMLAAVMVPAFAAGTPTGDKAGIYDVAPKSGCTVTPMTARKDGKDGTVITADANGLYADAAQLKVTVTGFTGNYYLVLALNDSSSTPTKDNIAYIDQKGEATFNVYPNELKADKEYHIWLSTDNQKLTEVASFKYYVPSTAAEGLLGDVNNSGGKRPITPLDASLILQYCVASDTQKAELESTYPGFVARADVNKSGGKRPVTPLDASRVLAYCVADKDKQNPDFFNNP